jgi:succinyl-diaminopimelate desuccinylase
MSMQAFRRFGDVSFRSLCLPLLLCLVLVLPPGAGGQSLKKLQELLKKEGAAYAQEANAWGRGDSRSVYGRFVGLVVKGLEDRGEKTLARRISSAFANAGTRPIPRAEFAWITHAYARHLYREAIINETAELIKFRTHESPPTPNRMNPEFVKQREYLRTLAGRLGLHFNDVGGYVQEIWIGEGKQSFGVMSHSDVETVDPAGWKHDPWGGEIIDGALWGRGTVDDKGPIVAAMYGMRAILDSGFPLKKKLILLVGTDEESANEDVTTYLKTRRAPTQTIVVDMYYPVICAEKGWCGTWLELPLPAEAPSGRGLWIADLRSGISPSIVPDNATAKLCVRGVSVSEAAESVTSLAATFMAQRAGSRLQVSVTGDTLVVLASGKSVHSSVPATGHNALMDLLVFLDRDVHPLSNAFSQLAYFGAKYVGFELDGKSLGIKHRDRFMGDVTVAVNMFGRTDSTVELMINFRVPRGIPLPAIEKALKARYAAFNKEQGVDLKSRHYMNKAHYIDPRTPFVQRLLGIYNSVTGERRAAGSIGGGTYARRLPNAVVFGPALPDEEYLGHQPNEHIMLSTLERNIELLTHTLVEFGF